MAKAWFKILRPLQWVKNLFVLAPLLFAQHLFEPGLLLEALAAFAAFCVLSSAVYVFNDVLDAEQDRLHPLKSARPVAAGVIQPGPAIGVAAVLATTALLCAFFLEVRFGLVAAGYLVLNTLYSKWLKRVAFLDVVVIAAGFVLRVVAGALAIEVEISVWLVVCSFFLACLLGFGKRRHELGNLQGTSSQVRSALASYSIASLRWAEAITAGVSLLSYLLYTLAAGTVAKFHTHNLVFTLPFPIFGIWRYLRLVGATTGAAPTEALVTDLPFVANLFGWVAAVVAVLYLGG